MTAHIHGFQCPETVEHAENPIFDATVRDRVVAVFESPFRVEPMPPMEVAS